MSIAAAYAADKDAPFRPAPAGSMPFHQTNDKVTVGVDPYNAGEKVKLAFGKLDPYEQGILPVLVVIQNDSGQAIKLDQIKVQYIGPNGNRVEATPASDVKYTRGPKRPSTLPGPTGRVKVIGRKNPLEAWEIEGRAFSAKMLAPGQTASGFFYFQTGFQRGATIYLSGLSEAATGKELFFFEIAMP